MPWARDAGTDILWNLVFAERLVDQCSEARFDQEGLTLEEKYEGGATESLSAPRRLPRRTPPTSDLRLGEPGTLSFAVKGLTESMATTAIASSTSAAPTPDTIP